LPSFDDDWFMVVDKHLRTINVITGRPGGGKVLLLAHHCDKTTVVVFVVIVFCAVVGEAKDPVDKKLESTLAISKDLLYFREMESFDHWLLKDI
jgi:hypothetical protein